MGLWEVIRVGLDDEGGALMMGFVDHLRRGREIVRTEPEVVICVPRLELLPELGHASTLTFTLSASSTVRK